MTAPSLVEELLAEQQSLTAVETFSVAHDERALAGTRYRDLIPLAAPRPGEQYAFEVELDKCSGCKACVTACHSLNGLDENETWREVGLLIPEPKRKRRNSGKTSSASPPPFDQSGIRGTRPSMQHVTTACHHCIDPACLNGCPVLAYEKDSVTGIVRHLDDQCIGCQYCVLKCPYDVPKYNARLGIVRKCDMCASRLAAGEPPACVQACPNEAIRITKVETESVSIHFRERRNSFLPDAPAGDYTLPTTRYVMANEAANVVLATPRLVAADTGALRPQPAHWPLVLMLVLSQAAVGVCGAGAMANGNGSSLWIASVLGVASIVASVFHLGRPLGVWRFFLGLKRSWLSREILAFGTFILVLVPLTCVELASTKASLPLTPALSLEERENGAPVSRQAQRVGFFEGQNTVLPLPEGEGRGEGKQTERKSDALIFSTITLFVLGLSGVFCSMMIYHDTRRILWHWRRTGPLFFGSTMVFGTAAAFAVKADIETFGAFVAALAFKLLVEISIARHVTDRELTSLKKTALLVTGQFQNLALIRLLFAATSVGVALLINTGALPRAGALLPLALLSAGEVLERLLFFRAVDAPKMPGGLSA